MDRDDLITFLAGTQEHIRQLFMSKAPYELTESWLEELNGMGLVDENNYKLVELKVFNKVRNLSNSGVINILDINEMIYSPDHVTAEDQVGGLSNQAMWLKRMNSPATKLKHSQPSGNSAAVQLSAEQMTAFRDAEWGAQQLSSIAIFKGFQLDELRRLYGQGEIVSLRP